MVVWVYSLCDQLAILQCRLVTPRSSNFTTPEVAWDYYDILYSSIEGVAGHVCIQSDSVRRLSGHWFNFLKTFPYARTKNLKSRYSVAGFWKKIKKKLRSDFRKPQPADRTRFYRCASGTRPTFIVFFFFPYVF